MSNNYHPMTRANLLALTISGTLLLLLAFISAAHARNMAAMTGCASNLDKIGLAMSTYSVTANGLFPYIEGTSDTAYSTALDPTPPLTAAQEKKNLLNNPLAAVWLLHSGGLLKHTSVFLCPADPFAKTPASDSKKKSFANFQSPQNISYAIPYMWTTDVNHAIVPGPWWSYPNHGVDKPIMSDMPPYISAKAAPGEAFSAPATVPAASQPAADKGALVIADLGTPINSPNHGGTGQNILMADGHVDWCGMPHVPYRGGGYQADNIWMDTVAGAQTAIDAGKLPAPVATAQYPYDTVMVPTRSAKGDLK